jgi:hypothetical protein
MMRWTDDATDMEYGTGDVMGGITIRKPYYHNKLSHSYFVMDAAKPK